jgi:predicted RNase H-like HicB family nuclease
MTRYPAWIDGEQGSYGVSFPDLPGIVAMGTTVDEALLRAEEALRDYVFETERDGEPITPPTGQSTEWDYSGGEQ